jgi:hypothetical protein
MYDEDNPLGLDFTTPINPLEALQEAASSAINFVHGAVRYVPQALTDFRRSVKQDVKRLQQPVLPTNRPPTPVETIQSYAIGQERFEAETMERTASFLESIGAPEPIAGLGAGITGLVLPGPGDIKFAANAGSMTLIPMLGKVTATDPDILRVTGRKTGQDIVSTAQQKVFIKRSSEVQKYQNKLVSLREELSVAAEQGADKKILDDIRDKIADADEMLSRRQSNVLVPDSDDPLWYKTSKSKAAKKLEQVRRKMVGTYLEEHHIFPKGMSAAFFNRMDELIASGVAEADDLLIMAEYAAKSGVKAGDVKSNLVNLMKEPHNELHTLLRAQGDEIGKQKWQEILSNAESVDDVLALWKDVIGRNVIPNAETAKIWQPLDDLVKEIQSK